MAGRQKVRRDTHVSLVYVSQISYEQSSRHCSLTLSLIHRRVRDLVRTVEAPHAGLKVNDSQQKEILQNLESSKRISSRDATILVTEHEDPTLDDELPMEDPLEMPQEEQLKPEKRRKVVNLRIVGCCRNNWSQVSSCLILATISI